MQFEVHVPNIQEPSRFQLLVVDAKDWFSALRQALATAGEQNQLRNVLCDLIEDGVYRVTETEGGRVFQIREVEEDEPVFAPPEPVQLESQTQPALDAANKAHTLQSFGDDTNQIIQEIATAKLDDDRPSDDVSKTLMDMAPLRFDDLPHATSDNTSDNKKRKKELASTMMMDFASIIEAQNESDSNSETVEFRDFATKEELHREIPSVIVSESAYTPAPATGSARDPGQTFADSTPLRSASKSAKPPADDTLAQLTGATGQYKPGMTTEMLADVFMRAGDISDFGDDRQAAMKFVLDLALGDVNASGGGVLLTDLNSPEQDLWFEAAEGPGSDTFRNFRIPLGQGIIGYYTQQGIHQSIEDVQQDSKFNTDLMRESGVDIGPMLCAPMSYKDRVWGCIVLFNQPGARPFTQGELSIMTYLAYTAGEYLSGHNS